MFEAQCPSLFTITPAPRRPADLPGRQRYQLRLYCEQPGAFHPLTEDPYTIDQPAGWLTKISPYLSMLLTVLKHAAVPVGPVLGIASSEPAARLQHETDPDASHHRPDPRPPRTRRQEDRPPRNGDTTRRRTGLRLPGNLRPPRRPGPPPIIGPDQILWLCADDAHQYT
jgi:hypothetical protein